MSVIPGLPDPPATHPASPQRARGDCTECSGTGRSPQRGSHSGSPQRYYSTSPPVGVAYTGSPPGAYGSYAVGAGGYSTGAVGGGIPGYRSPRSQYSAANYNSQANYNTNYNAQQYSQAPVTPSYGGGQMMYGGGSPGGHLAASPGTPSPPAPGERLTGEGESPRRLRAWGPPHTLNGAP
ncbi:hypothetical protein DIPPA_32741 [Diplonema papillatum]|nr:hypothetical protein DIPPA_32741 [Diplonema papillatum]